MIGLRKLKIKDAPLMLEWMKDPEIACWFRFDSKTMNLERCTSFIINAEEDNSNIHYAVYDTETDEYLGTISLKNMDLKAKRAEYAISMRKKTHGTGAATIASQLLLEFAFNTLKLKEIYLNVLSDNRRAKSFYKKIGFEFVKSEKDAILANGKLCDLDWYSIDPNYIERFYSHNKGKIIKKDNYI